MRFEGLGLDGAFLVKIERASDDRGFFARTYCAEEFRRAGIAWQVVQSSISFNTRASTVRGMHFQWPPSTETKLVRCVRGAVFDVLLDLRPESSTYLEHVSVELNEEVRDSVFIPHGVAHGFQTMCDRAEVLYQTSDWYQPALAAGVRWNDPSFGIRWPVSEDIVISERDAGYPNFDRKAFERELASRRGLRQ